MTNLVSIAENVSFSGKDKLTQIQKALEKALVSDSFSTNDSLYTYNEDRSYSGGEKQKIVAARAFYKNAPIYVFDEPTSALDAVSEYNFFNKLIEVSNEHLTIFVSHRMSSCKKCDKIVVLDKGRLLEVGNHDELIKTEGKYNELWTAQAVHYV